MGALNSADLAPRDDSEHALRALRAERRLQRERAARLEAESIAEKGLRTLYEKQQQLALLETIATASNQSNSVEDTLLLAITEIGRFTEWPLGQVYFVKHTGEEKRLEPTSIRHVDNPATHQSMIDASLTTSFAPGVGLPGRVSISGQPEWVPQLASDINFPRAAQAAASGLLSGIAFPIMVGRDVVAVTEFFSYHARPPAPELMVLLGQLGIQLGRVVERKRSEERLIHDASHDGLTQLPNRILFRDRTDRAVGRLKRYPNERFAVLFIDLDRFKLVNDSLGHAAGDYLLVEIARRFENVLVQSSAAHTLARLGGDEFTVLLEELGGDKTALTVAESLIAALRAPVQIEGQEIYASASIGIANVDGPNCSSETMLRNADLAMYRAKALGRGQVAIFDSHLHEIAARRLSMESDLRRAILNNEFVLHYQPIMSLKTGNIAGFESLIRWQRAPNDLVPPGEFIGIAEETSLIIMIGNWVLRESCRMLNQLNVNRRDDDKLSMSINISPRQFVQPDFVEVVKRAVSESGIDPRYIRLEITETVTIGDPARTIQVLTQLRDFGIKISVDDFGTGYSSLNYLARLPIDTLKIDRSFVNELSQSGEGKQIIRAILDLAKNLNIDVVAEGTEREGQVRQLADMGCQFAQGFYFSKPLAGIDAEGFAASRQTV